MVEHLASTLTLQDIADLAQVSRPAVSLWRKRPRVRGRHLPFPGPVGVVAGVERFDRDEIVEWLAETGRGNNPEQAFDAAALAAPLTATTDELVTLLCLHAAGLDEVETSTPARREAVALEADPADRFLLTETRTLSSEPATLRYVDDLIEASYGPADALARLDTGRLGRERRERGFAAPLIELIGEVATACRVHLDRDQIALRLGSCDLLDLAGGFAGVSVVAGAQERALRRRARIRDLDLIEDAPSAVRVLSLVAVEPGDALEQVDEAVLELGPSDVALAVGPATLLCDRLTGDLDQLRAQTLREGNLAMALRLPRGLWKEAHRQSLGLWVLHGGSHTPAPRVADLSAETVDLDDLAADVAAALGAPEARAFRYGRAAQLTAIVAGGPVVARGVRAPRLGTRHEDHVDRVRAATLVTAESQPGFDLLVEEAPGSIMLRRQSLGELRDLGRVRLRRGSRIDPADVAAHGTVRVLTGDGSGEARLDPFEAERLYSRAARTEPGDVIFLEKPRPAAVVDTVGGALVASPSRILRLDSNAPVGPHTLAALINEHASGEWETWTVPDLPRDQAEALDRRLQEVQRFRAELARRDAAAHGLARALIDGVAAGTLSLDTRSTLTGVTAAPAAPTKKVG